MGEPVPVSPIGYGTVPATIHCFPTYGHGPSSDGGDGSWSGVVLQLEDGVMWFLPTDYARMLCGRLLLACQAAGMNEAHVDDLTGWDETPPADS